jgi:hypothetical protein
MVYVTVILCAFMLLLATYALPTRAQYYTALCVQVSALARTLRCHTSMKALAASLQC